MKLKLFSTSTVYGSGYLDYCEDAVTALFEKVKEVIFVPYARPGGISHEEYTDVAARKFLSFGIRISGIHEFSDPVKAIEETGGIFIGGGNTFLLLKALYDFKLIDAIKSKVAAGTPYMGTSAGSNVAGQTISTTNDMPIIYPPSFDALALVSFNLNPHYLDPDLDSKHKGETRETRIREFHKLNNQAVVGLREGSWLTCEDDNILLEGNLHARIFRAGKPAEEVEAGTNLNFLLS